MSADDRIAAMIIERQRFDFATDEPTVRETPGSGFVDDEIRAGGLNLLRRLNQISGESPAATDIQNACAGHAF